MKMEERMEGEKNGRRVGKGKTTDFQTSEYFWRFLMISWELLILFLPLTDLQGEGNVYKILNTGIKS